MSDNDLFANTPPEAPTPENFLEALVGPGKQYADVEALAKAVFHKEKHINKLEENNSDLRSELNTRLTLEQLMDKIAAGKNSAANEDNPPDPSKIVPSVTENKDQLTPEKVLELIKKTREEDSWAANLAYTKNILVAKFGDDYVNSLRVRAEEVGLTPEDVNSMAKKNPKAVLRLLGVDEKPVVPSTAPPRTALNTSTHQVSDPNKRNYNYYMKMYKTEPRKFLSPEVQIEMDREAQRQGPSFYT